MTTYPFIRFLDKIEHPSSPQSKYNGYLSFLPPYIVEAIAQHHPTHRFLSTSNIYWLEIKDVLPNDPLRLEIESQEKSLWIYIDILGQSTLSLPSQKVLSAGEILCYLPAQTTHLVKLDEGKNWVFLIGINQDHFSEMAAEYPLLQKLQENDLADTQDIFLGGMPVHTKLLGTLESLRRIEYRPFSAQYLLAAWNVRLFNIVFQEIRDCATKERDAQIALYHKTRQYIREHYVDENLSLASIANAVNSSVRNLTRTFENRPFTIKGYIREMRLAAAKDSLIHSKASIASIAYFLHIPNAKHFSRLFKKRYGESPSAWRERMSEKSFSRPPDVSTDISKAVTTVMRKNSDDQSSMANVRRQIRVDAFNCYWKSED